MRTNRSYLFRVFYRKGVRHHHLHLSEAPVHVETQMLVGKVNREKKKRLQVCPTCRLLAQGSWLEAGASRVIGLEGDICISSVGPELEVGV